MRKINKATTLDLDTCVLDFEDGVAISQKQQARALIPDALRNLNFKRAERSVRINSFASGFQGADLESLIPVFDQLDSILLPKVENAQQVDTLDRFLRKHDTANHIQILVAIESAQAIINLVQICESSPRVTCLIFASEDYCADIGASRTAEGYELLYARSAVVTHAAAFRLQCVDMVCTQYKDSAQLIKECHQGFNLGYTGKQAIHPDQIQAIYKYFCPSPENVEYAKRILEEMKTHELAGKGAFEIDGKMIDLPMVLWARKQLHKAGAPFDE